MSPNLNRNPAVHGGSINQWAIAVSMLLQAGATVEDLEKKFAHARYEPSGFTGHPTLRHADSISDYAIRFLKEVEEKVVDSRKEKGKTG